MMISCLADDRSFDTLSPCCRSMNAVIIIAFSNYYSTLFCQTFNRDVVDRRLEMQGLQKLKCASCGTMFMSETETTTTCPSCSEQSQSHHEHGAGGCGCGH